MKISIIGSYISKFGELWQEDLKSLANQAVAGVLQDASLDPKKIEAVFVANMAGGGWVGQRHLNALVSQIFKHFPPAMRIEGACAAGGLALIVAELALLSGRYQTVLVLGMEKMTDLKADQTTDILASAADIHLEQGSTFPGLYALLAQHRAKVDPKMRSALSQIAIQNHQHALDNPSAQFHKQFTKKQIEASPLVAKPLRLLDCSPISDGASAVILTRKKVKAQAVIKAFGHAQDTLDLASRGDWFGLLASSKAAKQAYQQAGIKPSNIQAAEVHDCFTIAQLMAMSDLGFFKFEKSSQAVLDGQTTIGGKVLINPSGGLKACGHPIGATGVKQVVYLAKQIALKRFKNALAHNVGGSGATAVVHLLGDK